MIFPHLIALVLCVRRPEPRLHAMQVLPGGALVEGDGDTGGGANQDAGGATASTTASSEVVDGANQDADGAIASTTASSEVVDDANQDADGVVDDANQDADGATASTTASSEVVDGANQDAGGASGDEHVEQMEAAGYQATNDHVAEVTDGDTTPAPEVDCLPFHNNQAGCSEHVDACVWIPDENDGMQGDCRKADGTDGPVGQGTIGAAGTAASGGAQSADAGDEGDEGDEDDEAGPPGGAGTPAPETLDVVGEDVVLGPGGDDADGAENAGGPAEHGGHDPLLPFRDGDNCTWQTYAEASYCFNLGKELQLEGEVDPPNATACLALVEQEWELEQDSVCSAIVVYDRESNTPCVCLSYETEGCDARPSADTPGKTVFEWRCDGDCWMPEVEHAASCSARTLPQTTTCSPTCKQDRLVKWNVEGVGETDEGPKLSCADGMLVGEFVCLPAEHPEPWFAGSVKMEMSVEAAEAMVQNPDASVLAVRQGLANNMGVLLNQVKMTEMSIDCPKPWDPSTCAEDINLLMLPGPTGQAVSGQAGGLTELRELRRVSLHMRSASQQRELKSQFEVGPSPGSTGSSTMAKANVAERLSAWATNGGQGQLDLIADIEGAFQEAAAGENGLAGLANVASGIKGINEVQTVQDPQPTLDADNNRFEDNVGNHTSDQNSGSESGAVEQTDPETQTQADGAPLDPEQPLELLHLVDGTDCEECGINWCDEAMYEENAADVEQHGTRRIGAPLKDWGCDRVSQSSRRIRNKASGDIYVLEARPKNEAAGTADFDARWERLQRPAEEIVAGTAEEELEGGEPEEAVDPVSCVDDDALVGTLFAGRNCSELLAVTPDFACSDDLKDAPPEVNCPTCADFRKTLGDLCCLSCDGEGKNQGEGGWDQIKGGVAARLRKARAQFDLKCTDDENCFEECIDRASEKETLLRQDNFFHGTFVIQQPGTYRLVESITFCPGDDPQSVDPDTYKLNKGFWMGFFTAILIESDNVIIDMNGNTIKQCNSHSLRQRFFTAIQVGQSAAAAAHGPPELKSAVREGPTCTIVSQGGLGLSSMLGVRAARSTKTWIHDLEVRDFEQGGVVLDGCTDCAVTATRVGPSLGHPASSHRVPALKSLAQAQLLLRIFNGPDGFASHFQIDEQSDDRLAFSRLQEHVEAFIDAAQEFLPGASEEPPPLDPEADPNDPAIQAAAKRQAGAHDPGNKYKGPYPSDMDGYLFCDKSLGYDGVADTGSLFGILAQDPTPAQHEFASWAGLGLANDATTESRQGASPTWGPLLLSEVEVRQLWAKSDEFVQLHIHTGPERDVELGEEQEDIDRMICGPAGDAVNVWRAQSAEGEYAPDVLTEAQRMFNVFRIRYAVHGQPTNRAVTQQRQNGQEPHHGNEHTKLDVQNWIGKTYVNDAVARWMAPDANNGDDALYFHDAMEPQYQEDNHQQVWFCNRDVFGHKQLGTVGIRVDFHTEAHLDNVEVADIENTGRRQGFKEDPCAPPTGQSEFKYTLNAQETAQHGRFAYHGGAVVGLQLRSVTTTKIRKFLATDMVSWKGLAVGVQAFDGIGEVEVVEQARIGTGTLKGSHVEGVVGLIPEYANQFTLAGSGNSTAEVCEDRDDVVASLHMKPKKGGGVIESCRDAVIFFFDEHKMSCGSDLGDVEPHMFAHGSGNPDQWKGAEGDSTEQPQWAHLAGQTLGDICCETCAEQCVDDDAAAVALRLDRRVADCATLKEVLGDAVGNDNILCHIDLGQVDQSKLQPIEGATSANEVHAAAGTTLKDVCCEACHVTQHYDPADFGTEEEGGEGGGRGADGLPARQSDPEHCQSDNMPCPATVPKGCTVVANGERDSAGCLVHPCGREVQCDAASQGDGPGAHGEAEGGEEATVVVNPCEDLDDDQAAKGLHLDPHEQQGCEEAVATLHAAGYTCESDLGTLKASDFPPGAGNPDSWTEDDSTQQPQWAHLAGVTLNDMCCHACHGRNVAAMDNLPKTLTGKTDIGQALVAAAAGIGVDPGLKQCVTAADAMDGMMLTNDHFKAGTYVITAGGVYTLAEDIVFEPEVACEGDGDERRCSMLPDPENAEHAPEKGYWLGFYSAISIRAKNVIIDLNGHSISMSRKFSLTQRYFSVIELSEPPMLAAAQPPSFGAPVERQDTAKCVVITGGEGEVKGVVGLSSRFGIHGDHVRGLWVHNVVVQDFEFAGISLKGAMNVAVTSSQVGPSLGHADSSYRVPALASLAQAQMLLRIQEAQGWEGEEFDNLRDYVGEFTDQELRAATGEASKVFLFNDPALGYAGLPDGASLTGIRLDGHGVAQHVYDAFHATDKPSSPYRFRPVLIANVAITGLALKTDEIVGLQLRSTVKEKPGVREIPEPEVRSVAGPANDVLQVVRAADDNGYFVENPLLRAQLKVAELRETGGPWSREGDRFYASYVPDEIQAWIAGSYSLDEAMDALRAREDPDVEIQPVYDCHKDAWGNQNTGVVGLGMAFVAKVSVSGVQIGDLSNTGERGFADGKDPCDLQVLNAPAEVVTEEGAPNATSALELQKPRAKLWDAKIYRGGDARGITVEHAEDVSFSKVHIADISAPNGQAVAAQAFRDVHIASIDEVQADVDSITGATTAVSIGFSAGEGSYVVRKGYTLDDCDGKCVCPSRRVECTPPPKPALAQRRELRSEPEDDAPEAMDSVPCHETAELACDEDEDCARFAVNEGPHGPYAVLFFGMCEHEVPLSGWNLYTRRELTQDSGSIAAAEPAAEEGVEVEHTEHLGLEDLLAEIKTRDLGPPFHQCIEMADNATQFDLRQTDFDQGTYQITEPGVYNILEDIVFAPRTGCKKTQSGAASHDCSMLPDPDDAKYPPESGYWLGFFAAIAIEAHGVVLNLRGHTISMSPEFSMAQRFFSVIELSGKPYSAASGPPQFGAEQADRPARCVVVHSGTLGLTSRHGVHGANAEHIWLHNLRVRDFEFGGITFNGATNVAITGTNVGPSLGHADSGHRVPALATLAQAQMLLRIAEAEGNADDDAFVGLREAVDRFAAWELRRPVSGPHDNEHLFNDPKLGYSALPDGGALHGIAFHSTGLAVHEFVATTLTEQADPKQKLHRGVRIEDCEIFGLALKTDEVVSMGLEYTVPSDSEAHLKRVKPVLGPAGDVFQPFQAMDDTGKYRPNAVTEAQRRMMVLRHSNLGVGEEREFALFGATFIPAEIMEWMHDRDMTLDAAVGKIDASPRKVRWACNKDPWWNANKGVFGLRLDLVEQVIVTNVSISDLVNTGGRPEAMAAFTNPCDSEYEEKWWSSQARGLALGRAETVALHGVTIANVQNPSDGLAVGVDLNSGHESCGGDGLSFDRVQVDADSVPTQARNLEACLRGGAPPVVDGSAGSNDVEPVPWSLGPEHQRDQASGADEPASSRVTRSNGVDCACKASWHYTDPKTHEERPCTDDGGCCNPDNDPNGPWCFKADESCGNQVNWGTCVPMQGDAVPGDLEDDEEDARKTQDGCTCKKVWIAHSHPDEPCKESCCNPDGDAGGEWCAVEPGSCPPHVSAEAEEWGYCAARGPPAPGPERRTAEGCKCQQKWVFTNPSSGQHQECVHGCCNPDGDPHGPWCMIEQTDDPGCRPADGEDPAAWVNWGHCVA